VKLRQASLTVILITVFIDIVGIGIVAAAGSSAKAA
jgi:hypothetical protein